MSLSAIAVQGGVIRFPCVASRKGNGPNPFVFNAEGTTFVCPICDARVHCGPTNSTHTIALAAAERALHEYRHTVESLRKRQRDTATR